MLEYSPFPKQAAAHQAFLVEGFDRGTLFWSRRTGKSLWSVMHLKAAAALKQGQYHIVFNTHKHAKDVMWRQYLHTLPKEMIADTNATDLIITFKHLKMAMQLPGLGWQVIKHDVNKPPSTIQLLGSDYADDHRGLESNGMVFDEYQDQDPGNWDAVYKHFLATTKGWAVFMGTAKGYNHWYDLLEFAKKSERWFYQEATWRDNPKISPEWVEAERKEAEEQGRLSTFLQEMELQFRTLEDAVYPMFDRNTHLITENDKRIPIEGRLYGCWDFGYAEGHPMAFNVVIIDNQGRWFVTEEIHGTGIQMDDMIERIRTRIAGRKLESIIADSARPDLIDYARSKGLPVLPSPKRAGSIASGISLLAQRLQPKPQLMGNAEVEMFFTDNCKRTVYQFENYKYGEVRENRPTRELPLKMDDDHPDAIRYLALYLKYGLVNKKKVPQTKLKFDERGLLA